MISLVKFLATLRSFNLGRLTLNASQDSREDEVVAHYSAFDPTSVTNFAESCVERRNAGHLEGVANKIFLTPAGSLMGTNVFGKALKNYLRLQEMHDRDKLVFIDNPVESYLVFDDFIVRYENHNGYVSLEPFKRTDREVPLSAYTLQMMVNLYNPDDPFFPPFSSESIEFRYEAIHDVESVDRLLLDIVITSSELPPNVKYIVVVAATSGGEIADVFYQTHEWEYIDEAPTMSSRDALLFRQVLDVYKPRGESREYIDGNEIRASGYPIRAEHHTIAFDVQPPSATIRFSRLINGGKKQEHANKRLHEFLVKSHASPEILRLIPTPKSSLRREGRAA